MDIPIIQGGMGVGISLGNLAGNVAKLCGMGVISGVNPGYKTENFLKNPRKYNLEALSNEIAKAKTIANGKGIIGVNIMVAIQDFENMIKGAVSSGADAIICGAGMPLNLPELVKPNTLIAPIVSSVRALSIVIKTWLKRYNRLPDFVIAEGPLAGGHLGFKRDDIENSSIEDIVKEISEYLKSIEAEHKKKIYLFAAGGIRNSQKRKELMALGADGIQVGTPFIATEECDADYGFKQEIINATDEDLEIILSPVGLNARAIKNSFLKNIDYNFVLPRVCINCLKPCDPKETAYCISNALCQSAKGREGLVFSGANVSEINEITTVEKVIQKLMED